MRGARRLQRSAARAKARRDSRAQAAKRSKAFAALTSSALALPGLAGSASAAEVETLTISMQPSFYLEDDLKGSKSASGEDEERYEIKSYQFQIKTPFTRRSDVSIDVLHERMSGASPWFIERDLDGEPVQVMSGATIQEERTDVLAKYNYNLDNGGFGVSGGISTERDYFSGNGSFDARFDFNDKNTTITTGVGFSFDTIEPTESDLFATRPEKETKQAYSFALGATQVLTRTSMIQTGITYKLHRGYLSDPYKLVSAGGVNFGDVRPDERKQLAVLTRYRHHFEELNGSLHADYNFYHDDWGIFAHTAEIGWHQTLFDFVRVIPSGRYYTQSSADFYKPFFLAVPADGNMSSDYRLSPYGAISWKIKTELDLFQLIHRDWLFSLSWERYISDSNFSLQKVKVENPGLVSFNLFSLQLKTKF